MTLNRLFGLALILSFITASQVSARWAKPEEASSELESYTHDIIVHKNGTLIEVIDQRIKVLNETGRQEQGTFSTTFNGGSEKLEILSAQTCHNGKCLPVEKKSIETKPLASNVTGFDDRYQTLVGFSNVGIGTTLNTKYRVATLVPPIKNHFSGNIIIGTDSLWKNAKITIRSAIPLKIKINDPDKYLEVVDSREKGHQLITITLKRPCIRKVVSEDPTGEVDASKLVWVSVSSIDTYEDMAKLLENDYESVINQPLPEAYQAIKKAAEKHTDPIDQINTVTSLLADTIRYRGDWRTVKGRLCPRPLSTVVATGAGDCKDFSAGTVAILRALGYEASPVIVNRGAPYQRPQNLPSLANFNHAMVTVLTKDGNRLWVDPTNLVSMADGIFPDIADKPCLVLDSKSPDLRQSRLQTPNTRGMRLTRHSRCIRMVNWIEPARLC